MTRGALGAALLALLLATAPVHAQRSATCDAACAELASDVDAWLLALDSTLAAASAQARAGDAAPAQSAILRGYLDWFERVETTLAFSSDADEALRARVLATESRFHEVMRGALPATEVATRAAALRADVRAIRAAAASLRYSADAPSLAASSTAELRPLETAEVRAIVAELDEAERAYVAGDRARALARVEHAYLEGIELLEPRLPAGVAGAIERIVHLELRPQLAGTASADAARVAATFGALRGELARADAALSGGSSFWFTALNAFLIIVREGLEAVLLIAAMLAYLGAIGAGRRERGQIWAGAAAGIAASIATWWAARGLLTIGGASRELLEGITALLAVGVLLYVSHWLFQKTYIHDWKQYLRERMGRAVGAGSALAMASLAFAAVYREGFETVLFYQALLFDAGPSAVLAGALPGALVISVVGVAVVRMGVKLPLRQVFGFTNAILLFLAFTFLGKGIYNLQEAGLFDPSPVAWAPDHPVLRQVFGLYPLAESLGAQVVLLGLVVGSYLLLARRRFAREAGVAA